MKKIVNALSIIKIVVLLLPIIHLGIASFSDDFLSEVLVTGSAIELYWGYIELGYHLLAYYYLLPIVTFVLSLSCIIASILGILDKSKRIKILPVASVICSVLTLVAWLIVAHNQYTDNWFYYAFNYYFNLSLFYTILFILNVVFSVWELILPRIKTEAAQNSVTSQQASPDLNKLMEYKELLDTGIITQEEFDEKKRQILGR